MNHAIEFFCVLVSLCPSAVGQKRGDELFKDVPRTVEKRVLTTRDYVGTPAVSPDDALFACQAKFGGQYTIHVRDFLTGELRASLEGHQFVPKLMTFSRDGKNLLSTSSAKDGDNFAVQIIRWDVSMSKLEQDLLLPDSFGILTISRWGDFLVSSSAKNKTTALVWDVAKQKAVEVPGEPVAPNRWYDVEKAAITDDGKMAATLAGPVLYVWDLRTGRKMWIKRFKLLSDQAVLGPNTLEFSADGRFLLLGFNSTFQLYETQSGRLVGGARSCGGRFSPDGKWVASSYGKDPENSLKDGIRIYKVENLLYGKDTTRHLPLPKTILEVTGRAPVVFTPGSSTRPDGFEFMTISPDSRYVVTSCSRGVIRVWEVPKFEK